MLNGDRLPGERLTNKISARPKHFFWLLDASGSMQGSKIQTLNQAIKDAIPLMREAAANNPGVDVFVEVLQFANEARWVGTEATPVANFRWQDIDAYGQTAMGGALELLAQKLDSWISVKAVPPVIVLVTDGAATDDFERGLQALNNTRWGNVADRIAIAIGNGAELDKLELFTRNSDFVLKAENAERLIEHIRWSSTVVGQAKSTVSGSTQRPAPPASDTASNPHVNEKLW